MGIDLETVRLRRRKGIERYPISHLSGVDVRSNTVSLQRYSATETFDIGRDTGEAVSIDYEGPIPFTDTLGKVDINIQPPQLSSEAQEKTKNLEHDAAIATH